MELYVRHIRFAQRSLRRQFYVPSELAGIQLNCTALASGLPGASNMKTLPLMFRIIK